MGRDLSCFWDNLYFSKWGGGANPGDDHWTRSVMPTKNIYGLGVGISTIFEMTCSFQIRGWRRRRVDDHWTCFVMPINNVYGLWVGISTVFEMTCNFQNFDTDHSSSVASAPNAMFSIFYNVGELLYNRFRTFFWNPKANAPSSEAKIPMPSFNLGKGI